METTFLSAYLGDSKSHAIPMMWDGGAFFPGEDWVLIFTAKFRATDGDDDSVFQKASGAGLTVSGSTATVTTVPDDTSSITASNLVCDIQAQNLTTGGIRTVAFCRLALTRPVTRETTTSIPVITTEPPLPFMLPPGGTTGQILVKASDDDYDWAWADAPPTTDPSPTTDDALTEDGGIALSEDGQSQKSEG